MSEQNNASRKSQAYAHAVALLARREHGATELQQKLIKKGYSSTEIQAALETCQHLDLQSDARFALQKCFARRAHGYGPLYIRSELKQLGISADIVESVLADEENNWVACMSTVFYKKYGRETNRSFIARQKQKKFLLYRGFSPETIAHFFSRLVEHDEYSNN